MYTPRTDAAEARCIEAVRLFMEMAPAERLRLMPEFIGDIANELLAECREIESGK
jgi:hypothetical protein